MNNYIELRLNLTPCDENRTDILAALLADVGFESFVPDDQGLTAYIRQEEFDPESIKEIDALMPLPTVIDSTSAVVEGRDWNAEWEKNYFQPIVIGDQCVIHSSFHRDFPSCTYDIVIDPKLAFGTGHHATTSLIIGRLLQTDIEGKNVIDMGTGTGILGILAAMRGAANVIGIEIDPFAAVNARENVTLNNHSEIKIIEGDASALSNYTNFADLFLANINRNVITADIARYAASMKTGATIFLSGFYTQDIPIVTKAGEAAGLTYAAEASLDNWACVSMTKKIG